jgi:hypothetical protein
VFAHFVNGHDVWVLQMRRGLCFHLEPGAGLRAGEPTAQHHLQRHHAVEAFLPRLVDHSHPAAPDLFQDFVIGKALRQAAGNAAF